MSHLGHNSKVPIRIHDRYLQIIRVLRFAKCGPPCEGRGKWIMDYEILPVKTDPLEGPTIIHICNPFPSITPLGHLHQSPPSPIPGEQIRPTQSIIYVPL